MLNLLLFFNFICLVDFLSRLVAIMPVRHSFKMWHLTSRCFSFSHNMILPPYSFSSPSLPVLPLPITLTQTCLISPGLFQDSPNSSACLESLFLKSIQHIATRVTHLQYIWPGCYFYPRSLFIAWWVRSNVLALIHVHTFFTVSSFKRWTLILSPWGWAWWVDYNGSDGVWLPWAGHERYFDFLLALPLRRPTLEEAGCHSVRTFTQHEGGVHTANNRALLPTTILEADSPAPVKSLSDYSPGWCVDGNLRRDSKPE